MAFGKDELKAKLIDEALARIDERLSGERAASARSFLHAFYSHVPYDDIADQTSDNLYGAAVGLWNFARERQPGEPKIRVYDPRHESHGWKSPHTVIEIVNDDMPFLVDSVLAAVQGPKAEIRRVIHPILAVQRDAEGRLTGVPTAADPSKGGMALESIMHLQISEQVDEVHDKIRGTVDEVLADVRAAVSDWRAMRERCREIGESLRESPPTLLAEEIEEGIAFLEWLDDDHFTFLGYREYVFDGRGEAAVARVLMGSGLGLLRDDDTTIFAKDRSLGPMPGHVREFLRRPELLVISKAARRSTVHRPVQLDSVGVKSLDETGEVVGQRVFVGLYTSVAYAARPAKIPLLRRKVSRALERSGLPRHGHAGKALAHILDSYPRDELFQITDEELFEISKGILSLQERQHIALFPRTDAFERYVSCLVYVPRDRYDTALRLKIQELLSKAYEGEISDYYTHLTDSALARVHFMVRTTPGAIPEVDVQALQLQLIEAGRSWSDRLREALVEGRGEERGIAAMHRFCEAFPASYQHHFDPRTAVLDVGGIERALDSGLALHLYRPIEARQRELRLKIYGAAEPVPLSDVLPMLENMGLRVVEEIPYEIQPGDLDKPVWMRDFSLLVQGGASGRGFDSGTDFGALRTAFHEAFSLVWRGGMENDGFNRLVLHAGLSAREVTLLRALCKYLLQARIPFSQNYMEDTLASNPRCSELLVRLFFGRLDPRAAAGEAAVDETAVDEAAEDEAKTTAHEALESEFERRLDNVAHLDEDRILRRFHNLIHATLRTNFFQSKPFISFKLDSRKISALPRPRPLCEIFVYSPRVEAVHLRDGLVARGGIRWSDRREDFRTEILGLMKAQRVKNAVIVPVGSKGGFVVKRPPSGGREALMGEVVECYRTMMRGILDLTDNRRGDEVIPPPEVRRLDGDDPYLVVAADKGTATFSDLANEISAEYDFWLDDAFASGGSAGYDHKKMGITARGAWESVKRHFRELGKDIQREPFTAVGVGDMSGDVFGNGMLLSKQIRLVGAFNHLHVFFDPDPDPETSWRERRRLFELPRSTWDDYDRTLLSPGGGVFERSAKRIAVNQEMRETLGIDGESITPNELIQRLLLSDVELLFFGGIGTYVKARGESHVLVDDHANDPLRVDAAEVRAKVVGEGANLGMTQRARVELARHGGRLNTDSIDNSAGVDCSDHEVNIKILLGAVEAAGELTRKQRDELLLEMTDEVAELVLRDNYLQTQAITVTQRLGARLLDRTARYVRHLERGGRLDRRLEFLPDDETLAERMQRGHGFTRPEIAVLLSYAKMELNEELLASDLPESSFMREELSRYFPRPLRERFAREIREHRLRREIIATVVTNDIVNRVGITFLHETRERTGMPPAEIARGYVISREIFGLRRLWREIEGLDNRMPAAVQAAMLAECGRLIERGTVWFLREAAKPLDIRAEIERYAAGVQEVGASLDDLLPESGKKLLEERVEAHLRDGAPENIALLAARLPLLSPACDIVRSARETGVEVSGVGEVYFAAGSRLGFDWLRRAASRLPAETAWDKLAITAIIDDLYGHQGELTRRILENAGAGEVGETMIEPWANGRRSQVQQTEQLLAELQSVAAPNLSMLAVANRQLKSLCV